MTITPVILCGGSGTRLWPLSRQTYPKQFIKIGHEPSLFQQTLLRLKDRTLFQPPIVVSNNDYRFIIGEQASEVGISLGAVILEPIAKNTAPAIAAAAEFLNELQENQEILILPSDHLILDEENYVNGLIAARNAVHDGYLVAFGIKPTFASTGYGYIKAGRKLERSYSRIDRFVEKPCKTDSQEMLRSGEYFWNSGMFMFSCDVFLDELAQLQPEMKAKIELSVAGAVRDLDFIRLEKTEFGEVPPISVDYAVFEHTRRGAMVPIDCGWSDVGSWNALWDVKQHDRHGNFLAGDIALNNASNNIVISDGQLIALNGVNDLAIVATQDAVLVSHLDQSEAIKTIVSELQNDPEKSAFTQEHKTVHRPWGGFTSILSGDRFQVKKLFVTPGKMLSLQKHHHRSEHWIIVRGTAEVTIGDRVTLVSENQSIYIPQNTAHRLANPGKIELEVIEVQTGSYFGEDDIIRLDDPHGRTVNE